MNDQIILKPTPAHLLAAQAIKNREGITKNYSQDNTGLYDLALLRWYEKAPLETYYITGPNGSVLQLADGRFADTVTGEFCAAAANATEAMERLLVETIGCYSYDAPLWGDKDSFDMEKHVGLR